MERITYRKTLDVHKNGSQFLLQGFETADNLSRVIEISLMASGDAIDFPLERIVALMYVTTPGATEPSVNECTIKDNKVVYEVLPIVVEGITTMQLKLIEAGPDGATSVLASPKFSIEVSKSTTNEEEIEQTPTFTALEDAMAKAKTVYDERFLRMELASDCTFYAYYADGTTYETDILKKLFLNGNVELSKSYAMGGTGVRAGEDTDNSKYYSNVSKSESLNAKSIMEGSKEILEEVKLHGVYTAFQVNFETGEVEYVSPSFKFKVNLETGDLETEGQSYTFEDEIGRVVLEWLEERDVEFSKMQMHGLRIEDLEQVTTDHSGRIETLETEIRAVEVGGTGATCLAQFKADLNMVDVLIGTYTGNGSNTDGTITSQTIELGVDALAVLIFNPNGMWADANLSYGGVWHSSGFATKDFNTPGISLTDNGFEVKHSYTSSNYDSDFYLNNEGIEYGYIAFYKHK